MAQAQRNVEVVKAQLDAAKAQPQARQGGRARADDKQVGMRTRMLKRKWPRWRRRARRWRQRS